MEAVQLWAGVSFSARGGHTEGLLNDAAGAGLQLAAVVPRPGGFDGRCAAWRYRKLAALARRRRVRLRVRQRRGAFFGLRPLLLRRGLWAGLVLFLPLLLWSRGLVWAVAYTGLTPGQQARAAAVLRESAGLEPGARVTREALAAGEYALLQSGEFSWASVNFFGGRLEVEAAAAKPAPTLFSGKWQTICARTGGLVTAVDLKSGTALVEPGQQVEAGQPLIGTARTERDGTPIFAPAAGTVTARFEWSASCEQPLAVEAPLLTGGRSVQLRLSCGGLDLALPRWGAAGGESAAVTRHTQLELWGLPLPVAVEETTFYARRIGTAAYPDDLALAMARLTCLRALEAEWPDAAIAAQKETVEMRAGSLHYAVTYTLLGDIAGG